MKTCVKCAKETELEFEFYQGDVNRVEEPSELKKITRTVKIYYFDQIVPVQISVCRDCAVKSCLKSANIFYVTSAESFYFLLFSLIFSLGLSYVIAAFTSIVLLPILAAGLMFFLYQAARSEASRKLREDDAPLEEGALKLARSIWKKKMILGKTRIISRKEFVGLGDKKTQSEVKINFHGIFLLNIITLVLFLGGLVWNAYINQ